MPYTNPAFADKYANHVDSAPYNALYERPAMMRMLPDVARRHVLDAGCGSGWYAEQLLARGARVTAIDVSEALVDRARARLARAGREAEVRVADLAAPLDFLPDESVDGIVSALALHYLEDWRPTFAEFRRVLKPGGWLQFSTHHPWSEAARFKISRYFNVEAVDDEWDWLGTVRFYRRPLTSILEALTGAGFLVNGLVEPLPTEEFRAAHPEKFELLLREPAFILLKSVRT